MKKLLITFYASKKIFFDEMKIDTYVELGVVSKGRKLEENQR